MTVSFLWGSSAKWFSTRAYWLYESRLEFQNWTWSQLSRFPLRSTALSNTKSLSREVQVSTVGSQYRLSRHFVKHLHILLFIYVSTYNCMFSFLSVSIRVLEILLQMEGSRTVRHKYRDSGQRLFFISFWTLLLLFYIEAFLLPVVLDLSLII